MADLTPSEKLQPCLLDRLSDDEPESPQESRNQRVMSLQRYREGVLRDLEWLLNTPPAYREDWMEQFPEARRSVINFGIRNLCGQTTAGLNLEEVARQLAEAIRVFEPRIDRQKLTIKPAVSGDRGSPCTISFEIRSDLWARPMSEQLFIRTQVDLETGDCQLKA
jgi:type VI secretion system protein ImpF